MFRNLINAMIEEWKWERYHAKKNTVNPVKSLYMQANMAQQFLDTIRVTFGECTVLDDYSQLHNCWLSFPTYDGEEIVIGYLKKKENIYLLDSDFIYKRFLWLHSKGPSYMKKKEYYSELFRIGVIKPYMRFYRKPLCHLKIEKYKPRRWYFCISSNLVNFDLSTLPSV